MKVLFINLRYGLIYVAFLIASIQVAQAQLADSISIPKVKAEKFIFSLDYGIVYRPTRTDAKTIEERDYFRNLKRGQSIRIKAMIPLANQRSALGVTFSQYLSQSAFSRVTIDSHTINYIGLIYQDFTKIGKKQQHVLALEYSLGYVRYEGLINGLSNSFRGENLGVSFGGSYRYMISPLIGVGVDLYADGTIINEGVDSSGQALTFDTFNSLFRLSFGLGIDVRF